MATETLQTLDNLLTTAIHDAIISNINIVDNYRNSYRNNYRNYVVSQEIEYYIPDRDDLSSTLLLDIVTRFGSPGNDSFIKNYRKNQINNIGKYKKVKEPLESECPICLDTFKPNEYYRKLNCNHCFHKRCIDRWFKSDHSECPMCRKKIL
jgi:hypothetical protein